MKSEGRTEILCNPDAAPDWLADLYRAWRKAGEVGAAAALRDDYRRDLVKDFMRLGEVLRSGGVDG